MQLLNAIVTVGRGYNLDFLGGFQKTNQTYYKTDYDKKW